jgi:UPF0176 protein
MVTVAALYLFAPLADPRALRGPLLDLCQRAGVRGTLILAQEGVNGTIAGPGEGVAAVLAHLRALPGCAGLRWKESTSGTIPFGRMKVRVKREIVTMGLPGIDPRQAVGRHVEPADWNEVIRRPDMVLIDTRNRYEVAEGSFAGAVDPDTGSFREFPDWWRQKASRFAGRPVAMFCTGGIRCEKATSFLVGEGVAEVYHLKGGILGYLDAVPGALSDWQGRCFVFDERGAVGPDEA